MNRLAGLLLGLAVLSGLGAAAAAAEKEKQLYFAVAGMNGLAVETLLKEGADPNHVEQGRSLLGWAAVSGNPIVIRHLLAAGAKPDTVDQGELTPLMLAITMQHAPAVAALLEQPQNLRRLSPTGKTVAMLAVESGKVDIVRALIEAGADFSAADTGGTTPALLAAQGMGGDETIYEIIALMGERKVDLNRSNAAFTPLSYAVEQGNRRLVESLLAAGADHSARAEGGRLPLKVALANVDILKLLLKAGASPDSQDSNGDPLLLVAVQERNMDAVEALLQAGANVDKPGKAGQTPLSYAEGMFQEDMIAVLRKHGATSPKAVETAAIPPAREPTVTDARSPRNEYEALPKIRTVREFDAPGSGVSYVSGASVKDILTFYRAELPKKGWQIGQVNTDEHHWATIEVSRGADRMTVSLSLGTDHTPPQVTVSLTPHGSMKVPSLPRYPGSTAIFEQDAIAIYLTADAMPKVAKETMALLQAKGWKGKQVAQTATMRHLAFTRDGSQLTVMVSVAPAQGNKTTIQYSLQLQ